MEAFGSIDGLTDLVVDLKQRVKLLGGIGSFFADCLKTGKVIVPVSNGLPFIHLMGDICLGWVLFWQAGVAARSLDGIYEECSVPIRGTRPNEAPC